MMDRSETITLIKTSWVKDARGVRRSSETPRDILCRQVDSITSAEFFDGGRSGLNPSLRFIIFFGDYEGESIVKYKGQRYSVYRTYQNKTDNLELYVERKGGTNGEGNN